MTYTSAAPSSPLSGVVMNSIVSVEERRACISGTHALFRAQVLHEKSFDQYFRVASHDIS